ncbi:hypothetical protein CF149_03764 [Pseudomonas psychrophila]|nr:hypothetical protein CF149_03764 [Pseudomonas psychrophila]
MAGGKGLWVTHINNDGALFTQGLGLLWRDTFEFGHGRFLWPDSGRG